MNEYDPVEHPDEVLCPHCKRPFEVIELSDAVFEDDYEVEDFKGEVCPMCEGLIDVRVSCETLYYTEATKHEEE